MAERHRTVSRIVDILEHVVRAESGATLHELAAALQAPRSTIHGFVRGLVAEGYLVELPGDGRYVLGLGAHTLLASNSTSLVELVEPAMQELGERIDETVTLAVPVGNELSYVRSVLSRRPIAYSPPLRVRRGLWPTSSGKIFLAYGAADTTPAGAIRSVEVPTELVENELETVRARGHATNIGESVTDVAAIAVGIRVGGRLVGALSVGGPRARIEHRLVGAADVARHLLEDRGLGTTRPS